MGVKSYPDAASGLSIYSELAATVGTVSAYAGSTAPTGWLMCDGGAVSRSTYSELFNVIGTTYGTGDGSTTFNVPNLKGRVPAGRDSGQTEFDVLGETGGAKTHTLTETEMPSHSHTQWLGGDVHTHAITTGTLVGGSYNTSSTWPTGGGGAHNNLQPYLVVNYIIRATTVLPMQVSNIDTVFSTEAARDAAIITPTEGMRAYITDSTVAAATGDTTAVPTGIQTVYNGSEWVCVTPVGAVTNAQGSVTSTSFTPTLTASPGTNPSVTLSTGTTALISVSLSLSASVGTTLVQSAWAVSGASTIAASTSYCVEHSASTSNFPSTYSRTTLFSGLTAGTNTFTLNYRVGSSTGYFSHRAITVQGVA